MAEGKAQADMRLHPSGAPLKNPDEKTGKRTFLLIVPDIVNPFYTCMAREARRIAANRGDDVLIYEPQNGECGTVAVAKAARLRADGILFGSGDVNPAELAALQAGGLPAVCLNAYGRCPLDAVCVQGCTGTYQTVRHLTALGHTRIAFAGGARGTQAEQSRIGGYRLALQEAGIAVHARDVLETGFTWEDGYQAGRYFAMMRPMPTAICCANDQTALGVLSALQEAGIAVPEEISVTGMDDILYARTSSPSLTTATNDPAAFAGKGMRLLLERIEGRYTGPPRTWAVSHELVVRRSSRPPRMNACIR